MMLEYNEEQMKSAVSEVVLLNRSIREVAHDFNVTQTLLKKWVNNYRDKVSECYEPIKIEDFKSLQKRFKEVAKERDILKDALIIIARDGLSYE